MKRLLGLMTLLAVLPALGQEPVADSKATVRVGGTFTGGTIKFEIDGKTVVLHLVEVGKEQTIYVHTQQQLGNRAVERVMKLTALNQEQSKALLKAAQDNPGGDFKKASDAIRREFEEKRKAVDWVVVHGVIAKAGPILADKRGILVVGEIHDANAKAKPAPPQPGFAAVEGEMQSGKVELGKEGAAPFSVKAGKVLVAVAGKQATAFPESKGVLRVTGPFRIDDKGTAIIEAEKIEVLRK